MDVRQSASWMCQLDERILEYLAEESWSSPGIMEKEFQFTASKCRIAERCEILAHVELVAPIYRDHYEITGQGQRYLDCEYDPTWFRLPYAARRKMRGLD